jgi:phosphatidylserine/phosphatidylglycerophosphate/cardiolipin synthase-like enzyme
LETIIDKLHKLTHKAESSSHSGASKTFDLLRSMRSCQRAEHVTQPLLKKSTKGRDMMWDPIRDKPQKETDKAESSGSSGEASDLDVLRKMQSCQRAERGTPPLLEKSPTREENNERLQQLETKYLLCGKDSPPLYRQDSQIEYIIDGVDYFQRSHELFQAAKKGDVIWISGLSLNPHFDLLNRSQGHPEHQELGDLLAEKAADGVDVRLLVASGLVTSSLPLPVPKRFLFRKFTLPALELRTHIPKTRDVTNPPLAGRVALDWTGALLGSNHQKFVLVSHQGKLTALASGLDFKPSRYDQYPHNTFLLDNQRWGWHDASVLVTGPVTESLRDTFQLRWQEVLSLPKRPIRMHGLKFGLMNPPLIEGLAEISKQTPLAHSEASMQVLRSFGPWKIDSLFSFLRQSWSLLPRQGIQEIYQCHTKAFGSARQYIYIEDQFLEEKMGGKSAYEIYPLLVQAAQRNVKVILLGSGGKERGRRLVVKREENIPTLPMDEETSQSEMSTLTNQPTVYHDRRSKLKSRISKDIQTKVLDQLSPEQQRNIVVSQVEHVKMHAKVTLVDDEFASVGSANIFSRSMSGVDHELNVAIVTTGTQVRDLRVKLWAEHLRSPLNQDLKNALHDLGDQGLAFGIWRPEWLPQTADRQTWRQRGLPQGFEPIEQVLTFIGPE